MRCRRLLAAGHECVSTRICMMQHLVTSFAALQVQVQVQASCLVIKRCVCSIAVSADRCAGPSALLHFAGHLGAWRAAFVLLCAKNGALSALLLLLACCSAGAERGVT